MPPLSEQDVKDILMDNETLTNQNSNFRSYAEDLANFFTPRKAWINSMRTKGERVNFNFLYDSTAMRSSRDLSSGIHSHLTNPTSRWFALQTEDKELERNIRLRQYFSNLEDWSFSTLNDTNFSNVIKNFYQDSVTFGPATYSMLEDPKTTAVFKSIPVQQVNRVVGRNGELIEIYINFKLNPRQAVKMFGRQNLGKSIEEALKDDKKAFEEFEFLHFVGERSVRDVSKKDALNMPFRSAWIQTKDKHLISESGFEEMPYISDVFYEDENDPNGFSPAMMVLAEAKLVNAMQRTIIRAGMKAADPPLAAPRRGYMLPLNFNPAAMNYYDMKNPKDSLFALPAGQGRIEISVEMIKMVQESIRDGMFIPLFKTLNDITKQLSILETQQLLAQNMAILGPVVDRYNKNVLSKTIIRLINIGIRSGQAPQPPDELIDRGGGYKIVYLSPLAKAQRQAEVSEVQAFMGDVGNIGALIPSAFDKVDEDKLIDYLHRTRGITPEILREDEQIEVIRRQRSEQQQLEQALVLGKAGADIAKTAAEAESKGAE